MESRRFTCLNFQHNLKLWVDPKQTVALVSTHSPRGRVSRYYLYSCRINSIKLLCTSCVEPLKHLIAFTRGNAGRITHFLGPSRPRAAREARRFLYCVAFSWGTIRVRNCWHFSSHSLYDEAWTQFPSDRMISSPTILMMAVSTSGISAALMESKHSEVITNFL